MQNGNNSVQIRKTDTEYNLMVGQETILTLPVEEAEPSSAEILANVIDHLMASSRPRAPQPE